MSDLAPIETMPQAGGAYVRQADGSLLLVEGGTETPDRIAPQLAEPLPPPPPAEPTDAAVPRAPRTRRS